MDLDLILEEIGELGKFQVINYVLLSLPVMFGAANSLSYVFTAGIPDYRCYVHGCDDPVSPKYSESWLQNAIPPQKHEGSYKPAQCEVFARKNSSSEDCLQTDFSDLIERCSSWIYTDQETTIVNEWDITCFDKQWMLSLIGTLHFAGIVVGSGLFGFLADKFGRKNVFIFTILFMSVTGIIQAFSPDYITFAICTFLNALGTSGVFPLAFIIGVEMFGRKRREMSGIVLNYFYAIGEALVGLVAWIWPNWVVIQLVVSAPALIFMVYYWFIPESVRWLIAKQKNKRALKIIERAAHMNNVVLSDLTISGFKENTRASPNDMKTQNDSELISQETECDEEPEKVRMMTLFLAAVKSKVMIGRAFLLFYIWATNALVYYGLSLTSINLSGNKYWNFALVCLIEIPGYTLAWMLMNKGRRWSLTCSLLLCSVSCIGAAFTPQGITWLSTILFLLGKLGITSSFGIVYVHTAELLPTGIRSAGVGVSSTLARIGAMMAPFVPLLGVYWEQLPLILFGLVAFIGSVCALILPETLGCKLPDTIEEAERIGH